MGDGGEGVACFACWCLLAAFPSRFTHSRTIESFFDSVTLLTFDSSTISSKALMGYMIETMISPSTRLRRARYSILPTIFLLSVSSISVVWLLEAASTIHSNNNLEKYSSLPPTVFAPDGRLYSVERAAQRASDLYDTSSSVAIALHCGAKDQDPGVLVLVSVGPCSPHVYYTDDDWISDEDDEKDESTSIPTSDKVSLENKDIQPLIEFQETLSTNHRPPFFPRPPISLLHSPHLLAVTGGTAVDSAILLRRVQEISTTLSEENDTLICNPNDRFGKLYSSYTLARYCADLIQLPTQTTGGKTGRILSSSALILGIHEPVTTRTEIDSTINDSPSSSSHTHHIWRLDPTGQFWKVDVGVIGRGAGILEAAFIRHVYESLGKTEHEIENDLDYYSVVSNLQVQSFLSHLSVEDALIMACRLLQSLPAPKTTKGDSTGSIKLLERGLQAVVIGRKPLPEVLTTATLHKLVEAAARSSSINTTTLTTTTTI